MNVDLKIYYIIISNKYCKGHKTKTKKIDIKQTCVLDAFYPFFIDFPEKNSSHSKPIKIFYACQKFNNA
ncbi:hypothetical protein BpHYR1_020289 [Brachionus plicatilis]|uniref:Uncharacterized protein n=1 Tax=Brachionus plicatilis TaxID=10195 RepID=A0A3M7PB18_BRAPC|nr:hypothetical protein BpHYR1_020289 [Brachionus plicatilis]